MGARALIASVLLLCGGACSLTPPATPPAETTWLDQAFAYDPGLVRVSAASLFELDEALVLALQAQAPERSDPAARRTQLLTLLFGKDMKAFAYAGGHSTVAAETWRNQRGDCLSLSVLAVALARRLELPAQLQEVRVPASFDRRGGVDFLNAHVNVLMRAEAPLRLPNAGQPAGDLVIDFEPRVGSRQRGVPLSDAAVLARFLNNIASEHLSQGNTRLAYAHFKAAILAQPSYSASYSNLAQLVLQAGHAEAAEALLRRALALNEGNDLALSSLHRLLLSQGRDAEAQAYERRLAAQRERDPYYWLGLGLERLQQAQYSAAVDALERAQGLTSGFDEVHRYLAIAYWYSGQQYKARDQLAVLSTLDTSGSADRLSRKLRGKAEPSPAH